MAEALRSGAEGYILKDSGPGEIINAIHSIMDGNRFVSEKFSEQLYVNIFSGEGVPLDPYQTLTSREREVLQMTAEGNSSTVIGVKLRISSRTVEVHRSNCMKKIGVKNHTELIRYAIKRGILPLE